MQQQDFLLLLAKFNEAGFHFNAMGADTTAMGIGLGMEDEEDERMLQLEDDEDEEETSSMR